MKAYIEGTLIAVSPEAFKDQKTQEIINYHVNFVQDGEGKVSQINSRENLLEYVGKIAVFTIEFKNDFRNPKLYRPTIANVKPV